MSLFAVIFKDDIIKNIRSLQDCFKTCDALTSINYYTRCFKTKVTNTFNFIIVFTGSVVTSEYLISDFDSEGQVIFSHYLYDHSVR